MQHNEARSILGVSAEASPDDIKKAYRSLASKYHPDRNKEPGAEDKCKKINEAYETLSKKDEQPIFPQGGFGGFGGIHTGFNPFGNRRTIHTEHINLSTEISFVESVLGCKKDISFTRKVKCQSCNGQGEKPIHNGCSKCGGRGTITGQRGNMIFSQTCDKCHGQSQSEPCSSCDSGCNTAQVSYNITIPGGVSSGNILRLAGAGNYVTSILNMDQNTDVNVQISVLPDPELSLSDNDVLSTLNISLLEALQGTKKTIRTVLGSEEISIPPFSKNKEEIILPNLGVPNIGSHRVSLSVSYPDNLLQLLTQES